MKKITQLYVGFYTTILLCVVAGGHCYSQTACLPNFDFEDGNFANWTCLAGMIDTTGVPHFFNSGAVPDRHTIIKTTSPAVMDPYGKFSTNSPNGSDYCIRLGNDEVGAQTEQVSYTFTIPPDRNDYSLIFNYAVVFENPDHQLFEQPRFTSKIFDVTNNRYIECGSFDFAASSSLPGFLLSEISVRNNSRIYYRPWSSVTTKLVGYAARTIRIEFTTNDCTKRGHFGYAYIDVVNSCKTAVISGNVLCAAADSLSLKAPAGFDSYKWFNGDFSQLLGTTSLLTLNPMPPPGTKFALELTPFPGLGCVDTIYTTITASSDEFNFKIKDSLTACLPAGIALSQALQPTNTPGLTYGFFVDRDEVNGVASYVKVTESGPYYIRASNASGCTGVKTVMVKTIPEPDFKVTDPLAVVAPANVTILESVNDPQYSYTFWKDAGATQPLANPATINQGGEYYIQAKDYFGCTGIKPVIVRIASRLTMPTAFSPNGDGKNDLFKLLAIGGLKTVEYFRIYNRLGQLIYSTNSYGDGWDGKVNGKQQDPGVYVWMVKATDWTGVGFSQQGTVVLVR